MTAVGLRELRQQASDLVRRVEAGEEVTITVAGRVSARLVPARTRSWRSWSDVEELFSGPPGGPGWDRDRGLINGEITRPMGAAVRAILDTSVIIATKPGAAGGRLGHQRGNPG